MSTNAAPIDDSGDFTHVFTSAATTAAPEGIGANSVFALGSKPADSKPQRKVRASPQRERLIKTLEACGELNTDGISEAMGITVQAAADLAWKTAKAELIAYSERDGRKFYRARTLAAIGFQTWLEKKGSTQAGPITSAKPRRGVASLPAAKVAEVKSTANSLQHGGQHYKGLTIEPWDYIAANKIGFLEGNAIKYLTRWKEKNGVEDLYKALHYVQKAIEVNTNGETVK